MASPDLPADLPLTPTTRVRRHAERQVTDRAALHAVLDEAVLAHVGVVRDGRPVVLPFACARDGDSLLLHGSTAAGLLQAAAGRPVCVAVTHLDALSFARSTFDSSMRYRSAVVHGLAEVVPDAEKEHALTVLSDHLFPGRSAEVRPVTRKERAATTVLRVSLEDASLKVGRGMPSTDPHDGESREVWAGLLPLSLAAGHPVAAADVPDGVPVPESVRRARLRHRLPD